MAGGLEGPLIDKARRLWACNVADIDPARVAVLEAERDRLALEVERLQVVAGTLKQAFADALIENAGLRKAMPPTLTLAMIASRIEHQCADDDDAAVLRRMLAALATATAPPAAEAVTGGDTRRLAWLANELAMDWEIGGVDVAGLACAHAEDDGRDEPTDADLLAALRRAIDTAIALDTPQEADHAR